MQFIRLISALLCLATLPLSAFAQADNAPDVAAGAKLWKFCAFCHNADGLGQARSDAPKLAGNAAWYTERQLKYFRTRVRGYHPEDIPGLQMVVYAVPLVDDAAIRDMAAFIATLPVTPDDPRPDRMRNRPRDRPYEWDSQFASTTAGQDGDPVAGKKLYANCATCHGNNAEGIRSFNAPRLDNKQDWYLVRQMKYFQYGARGSHEDDIFGRMMAEQGTLANDQEIVDVVAYIMTMSKGPFY
jgi:cytochrome c oxidase subunit 2